jgi:hypothetical protein
VGRKFLGLDFKPVEMRDRDVLHEFLCRHPQKISGYTFATLVSWTQNYNYEWAWFSKECPLVSRPYGPDGKRFLLQPIGELDDAGLSRLFAAAASLPYPMRILSVSKEFVEVHRNQMGQCTISEDRDNANYFHTAADLATLPGRRFSKKRNLIAQFLELYPDWEMNELSAQCGTECVEILMAMARDTAIGDTSLSLQSEINALEFTMTHFHELEQSGTIIRHKGVPVGFSVFEPLSEDIAAVHFEKADRKFKGAFQLLNRETAKIIAGRGFKLINREEDLGDEGLRHAKLSYHPLEICSVYNLILEANAALVLEAS